MKQRICFSTSSLLATRFQILLVMKSLIKERSIIDTLIYVNATLEKHQAITPLLLAGNALSGCDTVIACFGVGKGRTYTECAKKVSLWI